jgi:hypothetical protein
MQTFTSPELCKVCEGNTVINQDRICNICKLKRANAISDLTLELCETVLGNRPVESWYTMPTQPQWFKIVNLAREILNTLKGEDHAE